MKSYIKAGLSCSIGVFLSLTTLLALAQTNASQTEQRAQDRAVTSAKYDALLALRDALAQELKSEYPAQDRVSVYLELAVGRYALESVVLTVDDEPPITRSYTRRQAMALSERGADRILRFSATPGQHRLQIKYNGYLVRPDSNDIAIDDTLELTIETKRGSQAFIMPIAPKILRPRRSISQKADREQWNWKTEADDPRLDLVRYLLDTGESNDALLELLRVAGPRDEASDPPRGFNTLMAQVYLNLGLRNRAMRAILDAGQKDNDPQTLAELWLAIAQLDYERGRYSDAQQSLSYMPNEVEPTQQAAIADLNARILIAQERYDQAADSLKNVAATTNNETPSGNPNNQAVTRLRYNYAIALINSGNLTQGRQLLTDIGQSQAIPAKLNQQANLALGYHLLNNTQAQQARSAFQRLPLSSPYSNRGLLGLGWAELAAENGNKAGYESALAAWLPLSKRDPVDPAVQEALIAVAFATEKLGQKETALSRYQSAIDTYTQVQSQLSEQVENLRRGGFRATILNDDSAPLARTGNMEAVYTSAPFQMHAQNYRDLKKLQAALSKQNDSVALQSKLGKLADREVEIAQDELAEVIEEQLQRLKQYTIQARLGLLRNYERGDKA